jgi:hypothetical protein
MTYSYRYRTVEDVDAHLRRHQERLRRHQEDDAIRQAYRNNTALLVDLYRAAGRDTLADLIERGRWNGKRDAPPLSRADDIVRQVIGIVRLQEQRLRRANGGKLPRNTRPPLIKTMLNAFGDAGELEGLADAVREGLADAIRTVLNREPTLPASTTSQVVRRSVANR